MLAMLVDQNAGRHGIFPIFFGRPASTTGAPATLAVKTGVPAVCIFLVRRGDAYRLVVGDRIEPPAEGDRAERALELTRRCTAAIEKVVREYPEQWAWMHRRWRTTRADVEARAASAKED